MLQSGSRQAPDLCRDVFPQGGLGGGEFDEGDGCLVVIVLSRLYGVPWDPVLGIPAGRQTARLSGHCLQLVITRERASLLAVAGGWVGSPQSVVKPL